LSSGQFEIEFLDAGGGVRLHVRLTRCHNDWMIEHADEIGFDDLRHIVITEFAARIASFV